MGRGRRSQTNSLFVIIDTTVWFLLVGLRVVIHKRWWMLPLQKAAALQHPGIQVARWWKFRLSIVFKNIFCFAMEYQLIFHFPSVSLACLTKSCSGIGKRSEKMKQRQWNSHCSWERNGTLGLSLALVTVWAVTAAYRVELQIIISCVISFKRHIFSSVNNHLSLDFWIKFFTEL